MGAFDLPHGEFDLLLENSKGKEWKNVMFTDTIDKGMIADCVEMWSGNYKVLSARFNGIKVEIPTNYHWELRFKGEVLGKFKTRDEAKEEMYRRKALWRKDKSVKVGIPYFAQD